MSIISAVMAIKHIAMFTDDESNQWPDKSSDDFDENLLSEKAKKALPFLSSCQILPYSLVTSNSKALKLTTCFRTHC